MNFSKTKLSTAILAAVLPLSASATSLDQVVVSANNTEQTLESVTANVVVINRAEIEEKQYHSVEDALKTVAGISLRNNGGLGKATSMFMRGDTNGHILVLIDGIDMTDAAGLGGAHLEQISINNIERIEIIKGAQSGVWGANATAGVINIITRKTGKTAEANIEIGSYGTHKVSTTVGDKTEQADVQVHFSTLSTDGYSAIRAADKSHDDFEADGYQQTDFSMKFGVNLSENHRVQAFYSQSTAENEYDGTANVFPYLPLPNDDTSTSNHVQTIENLSYLYNRGNVDAKVYLSHNEVNREFPAWFSTYNGTVQELGAQMGYKYGEKDKLSVLANRKRLQSDSFDYTNQAIALSNTTLFGKGLYFTQALRHDRFDEFENFTTGKVGVKNYFNDQVFISANYGTAYNAPLLSHLTQPNPLELKPEKSKSSDITLGAYGLEFTYFYNTTKDLIEYVYQPWPTPYYYVNAEKEVETDGIELSYSRSIESIDTDVAFNYTWLSSRNSDGELFKYRPQRAASLMLDYYGFADTHLGLETRYVGKTYSLDNQQGVQIGEYFVTNLTADHQVNKNLNVYAKIVNVMNSDYTEGVANATNDVANFVNSNGGRQFFIGIRSSL